MVANLKEDGMAPAAIPTVLVIDGHPNASSLCAALADAYADGARAAGVQVDLLRVRELAFDPILHDAARGAQLPEPDVVQARERIEACAHLVVVTPLWWGSVPALLKGFFDRVLERGWAYRYDARGIPHGLLRGRGALVLMTTDSPGWYLRLLQGNPTRNQLVNSTLKFCGIKPVAFDRYGPVFSSTPQKRAGWIAGARGRGARDAARLLR